MKKPKFKVGDRIYMLGKPDKQYYSIYSDIVDKIHIHITKDQKPFIEYRTPTSHSQRVALEKDVYPNIRAAEKAAIAQITAKRLNPKIEEEEEDDEDDEDEWGYEDAIRAPKMKKKITPIIQKMVSQPNCKCISQVKENKNEKRKITKN